MYFNKVLLNPKKKLKIKVHRVCSVSHHSCALKLLINCVIGNGKMNISCQDITECYQNYNNNDRNVLS